MGKIIQLSIRYFAPIVPFRYLISVSEYSAVPGLCAGIGLPVCTYVRTHWERELRTRCDLYCPRGDIHGTVVASLISGYEHHKFSGYEHHK